MWASLVPQMVKKLPAMRETWVQSLGWEDPLEKGTATQSSILAWRKLVLIAQSRKIQKQQQTLAHTTQTAGQDKPYPTDIRSRAVSKKAPEDAQPLSCGLEDTMPSLHPHLPHFERRMDF